MTAKLHCKPWIWLGLIPASLISFFPLLLIAIFDVWPPLSMVSEVFGKNYVMLPVMWFSYLIAETGHAFLLLFTYFPSFLAHFVFPLSSEFQRQLYFSILFYLLHGGTVLAILIMVCGSNLPMLAKVTLFFVPYASFFLERETHLGLFINYNRGPEIFYLVTAFLLMRWFSERPDAKSRNAAAPILGVFTAIVVGTKFSYAVIMAPTLVLLAIEFNADRRTLYGQIRTYVAYLVGAMAMLLSAFLLFKFKNLPLLGIDLASLYTGPWLQQNTPFLDSELSKILQRESFYYSLHILLFLWIALVLVVGVLALVRRDARVLSFIGVQLLAGFAFWNMYQVRKAQGTMIDISQFAVFGSVVLTFLAGHLYRLRKTALCAIATICGSFIVGLVDASPGKLIDALTYNSRLAEKFNSHVHGKVAVPVVYYMSGTPQPLLFPSVLFAATVPAATPEYMSRYFPGVHSREPGKGRIEGPHIAVIPEYLDRMPVTEATIKEWPAVWPIVNVFDSYPELRSQLLHEDHGCDVFQFREIRDHPSYLYHSFYPTRVTVCAIR